MLSERTLCTSANNSKLELEQIRGGNTLKQLLDTLSTKDAQHMPPPFLPALIAFKIDIRSVGTPQPIKNAVSAPAHIATRGGFLNTQMQWFDHQFPVNFCNQFCKPWANPLVNSSQFQRLFNWFSQEINHDKLRWVFHTAKEPITCHLTLIAPFFVART